MFDIGKVFELVDDYWYYFPFTREVKPNIYMKVKEGRKEEFEIAIQNEWKLAYGVPALTTGFAFIHPVWLILPFAVYFYCLATVRGKNERIYCHYEPYNTFAFFDGYFGNLYKSLDVDDPSRLKAMLTGFPLFLALSLAGYIEKGATVWFFISLLLSLLSLIPFTIALHKWWHHKNRENLNDGSETQSTRIDSSKDFSNGTSSEHNSNK